MKPMKSSDDRRTVWRWMAILVTALLLVAGCASDGQPKAGDRMFNWETNYVARVHVITNTIVVTNSVMTTNTVVLEVPRLVHVTNDLGVVNVTTNVTIVTNVVVNVTTNVTLANVTASVTNLAPVSVEVTPKAGVRGAVNAGSAMAGPWSGVVSTVGIGLLGAWAAWRKRQENRRLQSLLATEQATLNEHSEALAMLAQVVEVGREVIKNTPQGQTIEARYLEWMKQNQTAAGVIRLVSDVVKDGVDNKTAKAVAELLAPRG